MMIEKYVIPNKTDYSFYSNRKKPPKKPPKNKKHTQKNTKNQKNPQNGKYPLVVFLAFTIDS